MHASVPQVLEGDGTLYCFDGHHLFVKLVDPGDPDTQVGGDDCCCGCRVPQGSLPMLLYTAMPCLSRVPPVE